MLPSLPIHSLFLLSLVDSLVRSSFNIRPRLAARCSALRTRIRSLLLALRTGQTSSVSRWPSPVERRPAALFLFVALLLMILSFVALQKVEVALQPEELEHLDEGLLKQKYQQQLDSEKAKLPSSTAAVMEDVEEEQEHRGKKRKGDFASSQKSKKFKDKDFKF